MLCVSCKLLVRFHNIDFTKFSYHWLFVWGYIGIVTVILILDTEGQQYEKRSYMVSPWCRYMQFRTLRDAKNQTMTTTLTIMTPVENIYYILVDGNLPAVTWQQVGGNSSSLPMAMTVMPISDGAHYIATAKLESAFTAWLMLRGGRKTAAMSLGNAGKVKTNTGN